MKKTTLVKLERSPYGFEWACSHDHCEDTAKYGIPQVGTEDRAQFCLAHALEYCYKTKTELPANATPVKK